MIVWSGRGILIPLVFISLFVGFALILDASEATIAGAWFLGPSLILTGAFSYVFGKRWNEVEGRVIIDKQSGKELVLMPNHSFFWIKMQYWGYICAGLGLTSIVSNFI